MNQHQIQEAYLKAFVGSDNKLWAYIKSLIMQPIKVAPLNCTVLKDFQSIDKEEFQNIYIEMPGIKSICKLMKNGAEITNSEMEMIFNWIALHSIRNQKAREIYFKDKAEHENKFDKIYALENKYLQSFNICDTYTIYKKDEFFITSDNPVFEVNFKGLLVLILTLSTTKAICLSSHGKRPIHQSMPFSESINTILNANCINEIYSNQENLPISKYESNSILMRLK